MSQDKLSQDYKLLGLSEDATAQEARRAYHRMKALYADSSLATYSLLTAEQREEMLDNIERAYMRVSKEVGSRVQGNRVQVFREELPTLADFQHGQSIGGYLKRCRENRGMTLRDVSNETRIRTTYLEQIENEELSALPAPVYLRGFVLEFARVLGLPDPEAITAIYLDLIKGEDE